MKPKAAKSRFSYATKAEVLAQLRFDVALAGSQKACAKALGCSPQYLNDILNGKRQPAREVLNRIGFRKVTLYERLQ
jgi:transcriptional regulator with XRE-family HTH domain